MLRSILLCIVLSGCGTQGYIKAEAVKGPLLRLVKRHDVYMEKDKTLSPLKRRVNKRDGALLLKLCAEALQDKE